MHLSSACIDRTCSEEAVFETLLDLNNKCILELGCGSAQLTRLIATAGQGRSLTALEVDQVQHQKNLLINDLPNVEFKLAGAQSIPAEDESYDVIFMFKSLHHVPENLMDQALSEVGRVLKQGGYCYISEPVFEGDFNDVIKLFHDEEAVRLSAFQAIKHCVADGLFILEKELFFNQSVVFQSFEEFADKVINVTHSYHQLSDVLYKDVQAKFSRICDANGGHFTAPIRVDLLQKA